MKDRILAIIKEEEMTNARFAQEIGVQSSSISHLSSGRNNPSIDLITKILNRFPGISAEWLLQGKGKMYKYQNEEQSIPTANSSSQPDLFSNSQPRHEEKPLNNENIASQAVSEPVNKLSDESPLQYASSVGKRVEKVIILYSDQSFTEYRPNS